MCIMPYALILRIIDTQLQNSVHGIFTKHVNLPFSSSLKYFIHTYVHNKILDVYKHLLPTYLPQELHH